MPVADFISNLMPLEAADITWSIYPQGFIKAILFQTVAVLFQEEQLEIQIPLFQKDFSPAGKLRGGKRRSKFPQLGASLVTQWLRICLPMQGARVQALIWEDPTCRGATKPVRHNY